MGDLEFLMKPQLDPNRLSREVIVQDHVKSIEDADPGAIFSSYEKEPSNVNALLTIFRRVGFPVKSIKYVCFG